MRSRVLAGERRFLGHARRRFGSIRLIGIVDPRNSASAATSLLRLLLLCPLRRRRLFRQLLRVLIVLLLLAMAPPPAQLLFLGPFLRRAYAGVAT